MRSKPPPGASSFRRRPNFSSSERSDTYVMCASIRATASYRDRYIRAIPASPGSDLQGNSPNTFVDASASFNVNEHLKLIVEAQNLTDLADGRFSRCDAVAHRNLMKVLDRDLVADTDAQRAAGADQARES